ncbi:hypothetical protein HPB50_001979 [Hyalomma asiaticum]|uniref:Uncharacterized protein n=1 Tax=Hyalomma asiaticum TaxID=266040 RepID=A0ACB7RJL7_HYAAI|nr:hypothetical protein HPB50_001979 [Hyalomma asiaticum]
MHPSSTGNAADVAVGQLNRPGSSDWAGVLYGRPQDVSAGSIPLLVRSLDPTRTVRDLDPERVTRELRTESGVAPDSYCYMQLTRGGLLAVGARTADAAVRTQRVRELDGTPVEVIVPLWHGRNAAKIRRVPAWMNDADIRESLYQSAGVVSVRRLVAYGAPAGQGRRRDVPQTSVVLVFRPELSRVPDQREVVRRRVRRRAVRAAANAMHALPAVRPPGGGVSRTVGPLQGVRRTARLPALRLPRPSTKVRQLPRSTCRYICHVSAKEALLRHQRNTAKATGGAGLPIPDIGIQKSASR